MFNMLSVFTAQSFHSCQIRWEHHKKSRFVCHQLAKSPPFNALDLNSLKRDPNHPMKSYFDCKDRFDVYQIEIQKLHQLSTKSNLVQTMNLYLSMCRKAYSCLAWGHVLLYLLSVNTSHSENEQLLSRGLEELEEKIKCAANKLVESLDAKTKPESESVRSLVEMKDCYHRIRKVLQWWENFFEDSKVRVPKIESFKGCFCVHCGLFKDPSLKLCNSCQMCGEHAVFKCSSCASELAPIVVTVPNFNLDHFHQDLYSLFQPAVSPRGVP
jgi:hypothetical protein